jgi:hypothetical protein
MIGTKCRLQSTCSTVTPCAITSLRRSRPIGFTGVVTWKRVETSTRQLGESSMFVSVNWNTVNEEGQVLRDSWTSYQLLATPDGWRVLSYTNHF